MIIFINDIPVQLAGPNENPELDRFNHIIEAQKGSISKAKFINHVWVKGVDEKVFDKILQMLNSKVPLNVLSVYLSVTDYSRIKQYLKKKFKIVKASGGLVVKKKKKFLMIYRMKKWDLPKGKKEKRESYKDAAVREVMEECNVTVKIGSKICTTWHTYTMNRRAMLKKTKWYRMELVNDSNMKPSTEEDIEEVRWMREKQVYVALKHSYRSIHHVFEHYYDALEGQPIPQK
jgi:ADP-ribose pyrophosphatase YjhB (NUDIX family)